MGTFSLLLEDPANKKKLQLNKTMRGPTEQNLKKGKVKWKGLQYEFMKENINSIYWIILQLSINPGC